MGHTIFITIIILSLLAILAAVILYFIAQKFKVYEDPRIDEIQALLPGANCGGCGFAGCRNFAEALVKAETLEGLNCPVGGAPLMAEIAKLLGKEAPVTEPKVAVLLCNGTPDKRPRKSLYDGISDCRMAHNLYIGETDCPYGCLGLGDCVRSCPFDAMYLSKETGLPVIIDDKCVACGNCVKACPRNLIELRKRAKKDRKIYVACSNRDKGGPAIRACKVACIGCGKCVEACKFDAIRLENNLAYIDASKCTLCRKCVSECPTNSILEINFPPKKQALETKSETIKVNPEV